MIEVKSQHHVGDRACGSDIPDEKLTKVGMKLIALHRSNRKNENARRPTPAALCTPVNRREVLRVVAKEALVFLNRWEYYPENLLGIVQLASVMMLFLRFEISFSRSLSSRRRCARPLPSIAVGSLS